MIRVWAFLAIFWHSLAALWCERCAKNLHRRAGRYLGATTRHRKAIEAWRDEAKWLG